MEQAKKKKKKTKLVVWPYLKGTPMDSHSWLTALKFFLCTFVLMLAFMFLGAMMMWNNIILRVGTNSVLLLVAYMIYWQSGLSAGATAVNHGEMMYDRQSAGREVTPRERSWGYHPAKGFLIALLGSVPVFLCSVILALTAEKVMGGAGALPSWLSTLEHREEIGGALASYHQSGAFGMTDVVRLIVRMAVMPFINIIGVRNKDAVLTLERFSPLLVMIPALCYGVGYTRGVAVRSRVHADIEAGKRKIKRRQQRERRERRQQRQRPQGPGQLN